MAIGNTDFTTREKSSMSWYFGVANNTWELIEPKLLEMLHLMVEGWRLKKNESERTFKEDLKLIVSDLRDDPSQIPAVKTVLGL